MDKTKQAVFLELKHGTERLFITAVYGSNCLVKMRELWYDLTKFSQLTNNMPWIVLGDFNAYLSSEDKNGRGPPNLTSMADFYNCTTDCNLSNCGYNGSHFTWRKGNTFERLDRCIANGLWFHWFKDF